MEERRGYNPSVISILIPCKDEPRILEMMLETEKWFECSQILVANDRYGYGKGWAVREALKSCTGEIVAIIDGDLDIHPRMMWRLIPFLADYDVVVGKKQIKGLWSRRILTFLSRIYIKLLFGLDVETQTGVKIFRRDALFPWKSDSFAYDIEVLINAKRNGMTMIDIPVEAEIGRKMKLISIWKCFIESLKLLFVKTPIYTPEDIPLANHPHRSSDSEIPA